MKKNIDNNVSDNIFLMTPFQKYCFAIQIDKKNGALQKVSGR